MAERRGGWLGWLVLGGAAVVYLMAHRGLIDLSLSVAYREAPWPPIPGPRGGLAPWLVLAGAAAGGALVAPLVADAVPLAIAWGLAAFACLVVPAHALDLLGRVAGLGLFRPFDWAVAVWVLVAAIALLRARLPLWRPLPKGGGASLERNDPLRPWLVAAAAVVACLYAESVARTIRHGPRAWDSHSYHLPVPLQWIHLESLSEPLVRQVTYGRLGLEKFANPGDGHLLMTLPLVWGWDLLACLVQLPFVLLGSWAVWSMGRGAGSSTGASALAALAFLSTPIVANQAAVPLLDLTTAALSLGGIALLLRGAEESDPPWRLLGLAGLAMGLALGTKATALSHLPLAVLALATSRWLYRHPPRVAARALLVLAACVALPSAFWYARNAVIFANPLYPIRIRILGVTLAPGTSAELMSGYWERQVGIRAAWQWLLFPFRDPSYFEESGFGALFVPLATVGLAWGTAAFASEAGGRLGPRVRLLALAALGVFLFWFAAARTPRFNMPLLGIAAALAGPAIDALGEGTRRHAVGAFAVLASLATLQISVKLHGWDMGPPEDRAWQITRDVEGRPGFGIPPEVDTLPPSVIFNDTAPETTSQVSNYHLFGADHRHLVYDHRDFAADDPGVFVASLRGLGVGYVFLRLPATTAPPARYATPALEPLHRWEHAGFRSTLYRLGSALER